MLTKGTAEYKRASELAKRIYHYANATNTYRYERERGEQLIDFSRKAIYELCVAIEDLNVFSSAIATTVKASTSTCRNHAAFVSEKQAWCLACAAIENKINVVDFLGENEDEE